MTQWADVTRPSLIAKQGNVSLAPRFDSGALGPNEPGIYFDGVKTLLEYNNGTESLLPGGSTGSTHFAVFRDEGSTALCCSGVLFWLSADIGISTTAQQNKQIVALADGPGESQMVMADVKQKVVITSVTYHGTGEVNISVNNCSASGKYKESPRSSPGFMIGSRNNELKRYFKGHIGEIITYPRALNLSEVAIIKEYLAHQWPASQQNVLECADDVELGFNTSQMYAVTRYTQAIQSRNTIWPIKFNGMHIPLLLCNLTFITHTPLGMAFIAAMGTNGEPDSRSWGACNWWQNTRLPYGAMLPSGDGDIFRVILDYKMNQEKLLSQRTQLYWNHSGMWTTETSHLTGAYCAIDYGCGSSRTGFPVWLETSGYLHVDQGGDSGTGEYSLMALDYILWTSSNVSKPFPETKAYLTLAFQAAEYFLHHFQNRSADGRVLVWPAQVLETYWCTWNASVK